jgi:hypothetical protein
MKSGCGIRRGEGEKSSSTADSTRTCCILVLLANFFIILSFRIILSKRISSIDECDSLCKSLISSMTALTPRKSLPLTQSTTFASMKNENEPLTFVRQDQERGEQFFFVDIIRRVR